MRERLFLVSYAPLFPLLPWDLVERPRFLITEGYKRNNRQPFWIVEELTTRFFTRKEISQYKRKLPTYR